MFSDFHFKTFQDFISEFKHRPNHLTLVLAAPPTPIQSTAALATLYRGASPEVLTSQVEFAHAPLSDLIAKMQLFALLHLRSPAKSSKWDELATTKTIQIRIRLATFQARTTTDSDPDVEVESASERGDPEDTATSRQIPQRIVRARTRQIR